MPFGFFLILSNILSSLFYVSWAGDVSINIVKNTFVYLPRPQSSWQLSKAPKGISTKSSGFRNAVRSL